MPNPFSWFRDKASEFGDSVARHPIQSLIQFGAGAIVPGGGLAAGQAFGAYNQAQGEQRANNWLANDRANSWLAANGGVPADLAGSSSQPPANAAPVLANAFPRPAQAQGGGSGPLLSGDALAAFQNRAAQDVAGISGDVGAQIGADTVNGNYTRPRSHAGYAAPSISGNNTSTGDFAARSGASRSTNDIGGVMAGLGFVGMNDQITHSGDDNGRGLTALRMAAQSGDPDAKRLLSERMANIRAGGNTGNR